MALDLVGGIVPARPVGRAHQEIDFLPIERVALDLQPNVADDDDRALGAGDVHREVHDRMRFRRSRDDGAICSPTAGHVAYHGFQRVGIARALCHPQCPRPIDASRVEIEPNHVATRAAQELRGDLADEAEPQDHHPFAELRRGPAHALKRDCPDRRGRREVHGATRRNAADKIALHGDVLGVVRLTGAGARHEIAGCQIGDAIADADNLAGSRIPDPPSLRVELVHGQAAGSLRGGAGCHGRQGDA